MKKCKLVSTVPRSRFDRFGVSIPDGWEVTYLNYPLTDEAFIKGNQGADFLLVGSTQEVNRNVIVNSPSLRMLHVEGVGYDKVDTAAAKEVNLPVCNNRAVNDRSVAEHTVGLIIAGLRRFALADAQLKLRDYAEVQFEFRSQGIRELSSQHVGLIGMGAIGQVTARMLSVFGCRISYYDVYRPAPERERELSVAYLPLDELLQTCDVISLHVPALPATINMIGSRELGLMKKTALLVNTSRGEVVDQAALAEALEARQIYGAAVDTVSPEPAPRDHPLLTLSEEASARLILTPHIAGTTDEAFTRMLTWALANMQRVLDGAVPNNVVNGVAGARQPIEAQKSDNAGLEFLPGVPAKTKRLAAGQKSIRAGFREKNSLARRLG